MSEWIEPLSERWFFSRCRYRAICGHRKCTAPTGSRVYCEHCGAAICPRHIHQLSQCACLWQDVG